MIAFLYAAAGLALLLAGGEALVRGAVALAGRLRISPLIIGLTIVGFGTSTPELVVSVAAALAGSPGIALGNIVGSNIANVLLILGGAAALWPMTVHPQAVRRDGLVMLAATAVFIALASGGTLGRYHGAVMLALLAAYVGWSFWCDRHGGKDAAALHREEAESGKAIYGSPRTGWGIAASILGGLAGLIIGARFVVDGASGIARAAGVPDEVIGLTVVAVGTSLPELITSLTAARRGEADVAVGNVLGSNIFNLLGIGAAAALAAPMAVPPAIVRIDLWVLAAVSATTVAVMLSGLRIVRAEGWALLAIYVGYVAWEFAAP
jgi:cation:H+ antiporter